MHNTHQIHLTHLEMPSMWFVLTIKDIRKDTICAKAQKQKHQAYITIYIQNTYISEAFLDSYQGLNRNDVYFLICQKLRML